MSMTLLQLVNEVQRRTSLPVTGTVAGSSDAGSLQLLGLLNEELDDNTSRAKYTYMVRAATFTAQAQLLQGLMNTILPNNDLMLRYLRRTFFNRTTKLQVMGPITEPEWEQYMALNAGMLPRFRFWQDSLYLQPAPNAGDLYAFEYVSLLGVIDGSTAAYKQWFTLDTDTSTIPDAIMLAGLRWRYKAEKGLEYGEDKDRYEAIRANYILPDGGQRDVDMGKSDDYRGPGIIVPPGSWLGGVTPNL